jgi:hypothetical protein
VFEQQHQPLVVEDDRAGSDSEARVRNAHAPATHASR